MKWTVSVVLLALAVPVPTRGEVKQVAKDGFIVQHDLAITKPASAVFAALSAAGQWWSPDHRWASAGSTMWMEPWVGGCFCETWGRGGAEHGRVIYVEQDRMLRVRAALGPLMTLGVSGVLSFDMAEATPGSGSSKLTVVYRVSGSSLVDLGPIAPAVDGVIGEQAKRLKQFVEQGRVP